jgi:hypothetical protein
VAHYLFVRLFLPVVLRRCHRCCKFSIRIPAEIDAGGIEAKRITPDLEVFQDGAGEGDESCSIAVLRETKG